MYVNKLSMVDGGGGRVNTEETGQCIAIYYSLNRYTFGYCYVTNTPPLKTHMKISVRPHN